jgi:3D (Asp-Asp-Asp) domain-containing protein
MRLARWLYVRPWDLATSLALLALLAIALFAIDTSPPARASNPASFGTPTPFDLPPQPHIDAGDQPYTMDRLLPAIKNQKSEIENPVAYRGKSYRYVKTLTLCVTAYAPDPRCCHPYDGTTTASGLPVTTNGGRLVAADTDLIPLHCLVLVPGYAHNGPVPVLDRGGAIKGHRLDVLLPTFEQAQKWGVRNVQVKVYQPVK